MGCKKPVEEEEEEEEEVNSDLEILWKEAQCEVLVKCVGCRSGENPEKLQP